MTIYDDWKVIGCGWEGDCEVEVITPSFYVEGDPEKGRLLFPDDIEGFVPERGHEYVLLARRFRLGSDLFNSEYELISIISDKTTEP